LLQMGIAVFISGGNEREGGSESEWE